MISIGRNELVTHGWQREKEILVFFHVFASKQRRKNWVRKLKDENGDVVDGEQLKNFIANQYQNFFTSCIGQIDEVLNYVDLGVIQHMNEALMEWFTGEGVGNCGLFGLPSIPLSILWCRSQCIMRLEGRDLFIDSTSRCYIYTYI